MLALKMDVMVKFLTMILFDGNMDHFIQPVLLVVKSILKNLLYFLQKELDYLKLKHFPLCHSPIQILGLINGFSIIKVSIVTKFISKSNFATNFL